jgi:YVTN family beta-propeller protein
MRHRIGQAIVAFAVTVCSGWPGAALAQGGPFINFETIPTRAVALSPDGNRLFVTNTPDGRLEIFQVTATGLIAAGSVQVGLEPVAVNARTNGEVWVVNHLSDSVSVVDVSSTPARVVRTILVGDEPRDVVFAGPNNSRVFVTAARRGQNHPDDVVNETQREGLGRADVWVFDANNLGEGLFANRLALLTLFADKPGSMGVSPDGSRVFVSIFTSGNETTAINDAAVCGGGGGNNSIETTRCTFPNGFVRDGTTTARVQTTGGVPRPNNNQADNAPSPRVGIITKFNRSTGGWLDGLGRDWREAVKFTIPDQDVFVIDANANPPREVSSFAHVGTLNFSVAPHPTNGRTYVATIEAINTNRFLAVPRLGAFPNPNRMGPATGGPFARTSDPATGKTLRGHLYESRIAVLNPNGSVQLRHLNKHINYEIDGPTPTSVRDRSVANPQGLVFSPDGNTLFVAALGSNKIVPFPTAQIDADTFVPNAATHITLSGEGGPTDMVFDRSGARMFVYKRFDNAVAIVDVAARRETASVPLFNPEPNTVKVGRKFFYDARITSSNGEANCNVCHPGADKDDLPWDLGTPFFGLTPNPNPNALFPIPGATFNPLKGPMTPLTLRGIKDSGPMFWRGDITTAGDTQNERVNFRNGFGIVFEALNGLDGPLPDQSLDQLTDWALSIIPPPNPHRPLNNVLNPSQLSGQGVFTNVGTGATGATDGGRACNGCHRLNPGLGQFGTGGEVTFEGEPQLFKVTQLRTTYDKVGMFGGTTGSPGDPRPLGGARNNGVGPQIRASGTLHDGSTAGVEEFLTAGVFQLTAAELRQVVDFNYAFPSNLAAVVGQQATLRPGSGADVDARVTLLRQRASTNFVIPGNVTVSECDLIAKANVQGRTRGFFFQRATANFLDDAGVVVTEAAVRALGDIPGQEVTFTCVYPGAGRRLGIDRDMDNVLDANEMQVQQPLEGLAALAAFVAALQALLALTGF